MVRQRSVIEALSSIYAPLQLINHQNGRISYPGPSSHLIASTIRASELLRSMRCTAANPPQLIAAPPSSSTPPAVADLIRQRGELLVKLRTNLERAHQRMRDTANRHRRDVHFDVGDMVFLKLQQYRQYSVAKPLSAKLARRYYGPFKVTERIGPVAYRLELPPGCRIHNVFHVNLLRPFIAGASEPTPAPLPNDFIMNRPIVRPIKLLDRRIVLQKEKPVEQGLVQWSGSEQPQATWEPISSLSRRFPYLFLEDKKVLTEGELIQV